MERTVLVIGVLLSATAAQAEFDENYKHFLKRYEYTPPSSNRYRYVQCKRGTKTVKVQADYGYSSVVETIMSEPNPRSFHYKANIPKREDISYKTDRDNPDVGQVKLNLLMPQMTFTPH